MWWSGVACAALDFTKKKKTEKNGRVEYRILLLIVTIRSNVAVVANKVLVRVEMRREASRFYDGFDL